MLSAPAGPQRVPSALARLPFRVPVSADEASLVELPVSRNLEWLEE